MLEEKIEKLGNIYLANGSTEGYKFVKINAPEDWKINKRYGVVEVERTKKNPNIVVFATNSPNISFSEIIDIILEAITPYLVILEKQELFELYIKEIEDIFVNNDLPFLKTLKFEFSGKQKRTYNKNKQSETEATLNNKEISLETNEDKRILLSENEELIK